MSAWKHCPHCLRGYTGHACECDGFVHGPLNVSVPPDAPAVGGTRPSPPPSTKDGTP